MPRVHGSLDVGDGHAIWWEVHGAADGKPAVVLHGGPGSGAGAWWTELFDLERYRVLLFDQRGCGRSTPHAGAPAVDLSANTTDHLIADVERLRGHLGIERWLVLGGSWGSTLGLAYAQRHPDRVTEMVLFSVVTTTAREVEWVTEGVAPLFPEAWERLRAGAEGRAEGEPLVDAYNNLLVDPDPAVHVPAARAWCAWEDAHVGGDADPRYDDPTFRLAFARLVTHYWRHAAWRGPTELADGAAAIAHVPAVLIHGDRDVGSPADVAEDLAGRWPAAELQILADRGHGAGGTASAAITAALARFA
ncbi:Proline iminopeptidase [Baekduia alba]|uniref:prolyl aminopeptidase n=1 Tax=Baekduia alba TaxID=2997333 RepID=UPI00233FD472|nr:prolyl aminopeptidase [Baekduia alba]WCB94124.1 Proline iminopeptidase [Baekduia alba]